MDPKKLFPEAPEDLSTLDDDAVKALLEESEKAVDLIVADDADFLKGLEADEVIAQLEPGVALVKALREDVAAREQAFQTYTDKKAEIAQALAENNDADDDGAVTEEAEIVAEAEAVTEEAAEVETAEEPVLVTASVTPAVRYSRTPPAPAPDRMSIATVEPKGSALVASGGYKEQFSGPLNPATLAELNRSVALEHGPAEKNGKKTYVDGPHGRAVFDGPRVKTARADFSYPEDRVLYGDDGDIEKIRAAMPPSVNFLGQPGTMGQEALVASGGLCAPLTPIYTMPNFGTEAEPVWDSLPVFQAARGGVNVPAATYIADITSAISSISEADDALGGTFATKSCQDLECPAYTETAIQILAHCREYGNLNARAWPEKIAHENALTMQALSRTSEGFMLDRIKSLSVNVTVGAETLGALIYLVDGLEKAKFGIRSRLRMPREARFRALLPAVILDLLELDTIQTQYDRFRTADELVAYLRRLNIEPTFYLDTPSTGASQIADSAQTDAALDGFPDTIQGAVFPEGAFLGIDSGVLELGIVRDSTLNSTNDFQNFGEKFRNVALLGPAQSAYWITFDLCANGNFPPAGTSRTCD